MKGSIACLVVLAGEATTDPLTRALSEPTSAFVSGAVPLSDLSVTWKGGAFGFVSEPWVLCSSEQKPGWSASPLISGSLALTYTGLLAQVWGLCFSDALRNRVGGYRAVLHPDWRQSGLFWLMVSRQGGKHMPFRAGPALLRTR